MIGQRLYLRDRSPELAAEIVVLLERAGRQDLADSIPDFAIQRIEQNPQQLTLSILGADGQLAYSLELDARGIAIDVDISDQHEIIAIHLRPPAD